MVEVGDDLEQRQVVVLQPLGDLVGQAQPLQPQQRRLPQGQDRPPQRTVPLGPLARVEVGAVAAVDELERPAAGPRTPSSAAPRWGGRSSRGSRGRRGAPRRPRRRPRRRRRSGRGRRRRSRAAAARPASRWRRARRSSSRSSARLASSEKWLKARTTCSASRWSSAPRWAIRAWAAPPSRRRRRASTRVRSTRPKTASPAWSRMTSPSTRPSSRMSARSSSFASVAAAACSGDGGTPTRGDVDHAGSIPGRGRDRNRGRPAFSRGSRSGRSAARRGNGRPAMRARSLASWPRPASSCVPGGCCRTCSWCCSSSRWWPWGSGSSAGSTRSASATRSSSPAWSSRSCPSRTSSTPRATAASATPGSARSPPREPTTTTPPWSSATAARTVWPGRGWSRRWRWPTARRWGCSGGSSPSAPTTRPTRRRRPTGEVTVEGLVVDPGSFDGTAPKDLEGLLAEEDTLPGLVLAETSTPPEPDGASPDAFETGSIVVVPPPELSEGPHLGYAVQWFIFSTIAVVGYPLVLRRVVIRRGKEVDDDPADDDPPGARRPRRRAGRAVAPGGLSRRRSRRGRRGPAARHRRGLRVHRARRDRVDHRRGHRPRGRRQPGHGVPVVPRGPRRARVRGGDACRRRLLRRARRRDRRARRRGHAAGAGAPRRTPPARRPRRPAAGAAGRGRSDRAAAGLGDADGDRAAAGRAGAEAAARAPASGGRAGRGRRPAGPHDPVVDGRPGSWDLDDPAAVRRLVRDQLLAGVLAEAPGD